MKTSKLLVSAMITGLVSSATMSLANANEEAAAPAAKDAKKVMKKGKHGCKGKGGCGGKNQCSGKKENAEGKEAPAADAPKTE